jgi:hypothetical protein
VSEDVQTTEGVQQQTEPEAQDGADLAAVAERGAPDPGADTAPEPLVPSAELKAIVEALVFASPDPLTPKALYKMLDNEPRELVDAALAALEEDYEGEAACSSSRSLAASRSSRGPSCTSGCVASSTSRRRRSCRCRRSRPLP